MKLEQFESKKQKAINKELNSLILRMNLTTLIEMDTKKQSTPKPKEENTGTNIIGRML